MSETLELECPQCGINQNDRNPDYLIYDIGFGMLECPVCGYVWRSEPEAR
jgi:rubredoxin